MPIATLPLALLLIYTALAMQGCDLFLLFISRRLDFSQLRWLLLSVG